MAKLLGLMFHHANQFIVYEWANKKRNLSAFAESKKNEKLAIWVDLKRQGIKQAASQRALADVISSMSADISEQGRL